MIDQGNASSCSGGKDLPLIARQAVREHFLGTKPAPAEACGDYLARRRGVFVTIRTRAGRLRGCRGTIQPQSPNLIEETRAVAVSSALYDNRFDPVTPSELDNLTFEVSVLHAAEPVASAQQLDPAVYGIIVRARDGRRGLMLPQVEGLDTPEAQLEATRRKAGILPEEEVEIFRFQVDKFIESSLGSSSGKTA